MLIIGCLAVFGWKYAAPILERRAQVNTSDAVKVKGTMKIGVDNFLGYYVLCSPYLRSLMRNASYELQCADDDAAYEKRMEQLQKGEIQFAVATIDSYELNALKAKFPGLLFMVIDRSTGADGALGRKNKVTNIDDIKRGGLKVAFAPGTPSEHLIKVLSRDFDIPQWRSRDKSWQVLAKSSQDAMKKFEAGQADVVFGWEPDLTKMLQGNPDTVVKIIGTEVAPRAIIDILMVQRDYARAHSEVVTLLLSNYFRSLYYYRTNPDVALVHAAEFAKIDRKYIADAMKGVTWVNLAENATLWFGIPEPGQQPQFGLIEAIESTMRILIEYGDFKENPLPDKGNPRSIVWSDPIEQLYRSGLADNEKVDPKSADAFSRDFSELTDEEWNMQRAIGTLSMLQQITFPSGVDILSANAKEIVDRLAETVKGYPGLRIVVDGHTSTRGDARVNLELSQDRAEAVARYFMVTYGVKQNRIHAVGYGGSKPLKQRLDETDREHQSRLPRVVVKLVTEAF